MLMAVSCADYACVVLTLYSLLHCRGVVASSLQLHPKPHRYRVIRGAAPGFVNGTTFGIEHLYERAASFTSKQQSLVLGMLVNGHDATIAGTLNGNVFGVVELERIHQIRYFNFWWAMGIKALRDGWERLNWRMQLILAIEHFFVPAFNKLCEMAPSHISKKSGRSCRITYDAAVVVFQYGLNDYLELVLELQKRFVLAKEWLYVDHHHAHAAMGWFDSPFYQKQSGYSKTLVVSYDGAGNDGSFRTFIAHPGEEQLKPLGWPEKRHSLGLSYEVATQVVRDLGWGSPYGHDPPCPWHVNPSCHRALPGSFMAYAALGAIREEWLNGAKLFLKKGFWQDSSWPSPHGGICQLVQNNEYYGSGFLPGMVSHYFACNNSDEESSRQCDKDFAATVQFAFEEMIVAELKKRVASVHGRKPDSVVIAGGCALNVKANSAIARQLNLTAHVPSAPGDDGLAVGAAWLLRPPQMHAAGALHFAGVPLAFLNKPFNSSNFLEFASSYGATELLSPKHLAAKLVDGAIVGVLRGQSETGPRALGHRSLLAVADKVETKNRLNRLKNRRWYRPCAPMVCIEDLECIFEPGPDLSLGSPYMSFAPPLRPWVEKVFPAIWHLDGTARLQGVSGTGDPWMHSVLAEVRELSFAGGIDRANGSSPCPAGVLINTSLNRKGKPIVSDVLDALLMFCEPGGDELDYVLIEEKVMFQRSSVLSRGFCQTYASDSSRSKSSPDNLPMI